MSLKESTNALIKADLDKTLKQITVFGLVGILATAAHGLSAYGVIYWANASNLQANLCGYILAFPVSYIGHCKFSFKAKFGLMGLTRFFWINSWLFAITISLSLYLDSQSISPVMGVTLTMVVIPIISFVVHKFITFR